MKVMRFLNTYGFYLKKTVVLETHKEEKTRREIEKSIKFIGNRLPSIMLYDKPLIRPCTVSFDIPETQNEAFLHMDGMDNKEITFRLDVARKGTQKIYSRYLKSYPHSEIAFRFARRFDCEEIYDSVVFLSKKADEYWNGSSKIIQEDKTDA